MPDKFWIVSLKKLRQAFAEESFGTGKLIKNFSSYYVFSLFEGTYY